ncbi:MAG: hypothetical protein ACE5I3_14540, partial [Phycisphaerae bacterium]
MRCLVIVAAIGMIAAPAFASPELLPVKGTHYATYKAATGELTPTPGPVRFGLPVWSSINDTGWYFGSYKYDWVLLDWGDIAGPQDIGGFQFAYATEMVLPDRLDTIMWFYAEDNGWNSYGRVPLAGFTIADLPTGDPGGQWNGWIVTVDIAGLEFTIDGSDLDADGLTDFSYTYWFQGPPAGDATGPHISGMENDPQAPGSESAFDGYLTNDPNNGSPDIYTGTWWYGPPPDNPFAQHYLELYEGNAPNEPNGCPNPGGSGKFCFADIDGSGDCIVGLADLAQLLSNYGMTTGATQADGDLEPAPPNGDGDV